MVAYSKADSKLIMILKCLDFYFFYNYCFYRNEFRQGEGGAPVRRVHVVQREELADAGQNGERALQERLRARRRSQQRGRGLVHTIPGKRPRSEYDLHEFGTKRSLPTARFSTKQNETKGNDMT